MNHFLAFDWFFLMFHRLNDSFAKLLIREFTDELIDLVRPPADAEKLIGTDFKIIAFCIKFHMNSNKV